MDLNSSPGAVLSVQGSVIPYFIPCFDCCDGAVITESAASIFLNPVQRWTFILSRSSVQTADLTR